MGVADPNTRSSFHKQSLIVVNGRIYVADDHNKLWAYQSGETIFADSFEGYAPTTTPASTPPPGPTQASVVLGTWPNAKLAARASLRSSVQR
jgi:hypothetical protein